MYFLPVVMIAYFMLPYKNTVLLIASLFFYSWGEPKYIVLMIVTVLINYVCALNISDHRNHANLYLIIALTFSLGALIIFKYSDFIMNSSNTLFNTNFNLLNLSLPIGISFYTFQIISYTVDVYRDDVNVQRNYFTLLTYLSLFPQLIAGPIVRYADVEDELQHRVHSYDKIFEGVKRFTVGLSKKVILANTLGEVVAAFHAQTNSSFVMTWIYALAFTLQLYYDFSGYSDMAIGLGKIFGFNFLENFNYPLIASSITDFWRRWHISLSSFFRDYVYIPLGGSRVKKSRWIINILIVWTLTGLWHGAAFNFMLWGFLFAIILIVEKILKIDPNKRGILKSLWVIIIVLLSFVIFDNSNLSNLLETVKTMFMVNSPNVINSENLLYIANYKLVFFVAIIGATPFVSLAYHKLMTRFSENTQSIIETVLIIFSFALCVAILVDSNFNPFLYFRF